MNTVVFPITGSVDQLKEELKVAQAGEQEAKRQLATGECVLTRVTHEKNKLQDSNTLLGEELKRRVSPASGCRKREQEATGRLIQYAFELTFV